VQAWSLGPDGSWTRRTPGDGEEPHNSQEQFMARARSRAAEHALVR
jgi:hypothetical protein